MHTAHSNPVNSVTRQLIPSKILWFLWEGVTSIPIHYIAHNDGLSDLIALTTGLKVATHYLIARYIFQHLTMSSHK